MTPFCEVLKRERLRRKLSLAEMARLLGCSPPNVHSVECGANIKEETIRRWAEALGLEVDLRFYKRRPK